MKYFLLFSLWISTCLCDFQSHNCVWDSKEAFNVKFDTQNIECISRGTWPQHSKAPCMIDEMGLGGFRDIYGSECRPMLNKQDKLMCKFNAEGWKTGVGSRLNMIKAHFPCFCDENGKNPECKMIVEVEFNSGQHDYSISEYIFSIIIAIIIVGIGTLILGCICTSPEAAGLLGFGLGMAAGDSGYSSGDYTFTACQD